jgi:hypothetical protein
MQGVGGSLGSPTGGIQWNIPGPSSGPNPYNTLAQGGSPGETLGQWEAGNQYQLGLGQLGLGQAQLAQQGSQFNQVFGALQGMLGGLGSTSPGGTNTAQPGVTANQVWTPQQVQQQVNTAQANATQGAQSQAQSMAAKMAGQGFGSRSPALAAQQQNAMLQALAAGQNSAQNIQYQAAQGNAQQQLAGQQLQQQAWQNWNQADIARRQQSTQLAAAGLGALAGII